MRIDLTDDHRFFPSRPLVADLIYTNILRPMPALNACCAGFVVLLHQMCNTKIKERQGDPTQGGNCSRGEKKT
jgi:hypothetical protein